MQTPPQNATAGVVTSAAILIQTQLREFALSGCCFSEAMVALPAGHNRSHPALRYGAWFRTSAHSTTLQTPFVLTPAHGRAAVVPAEDGAFVSIKGVGWTWTIPTVLRSNKDAQLTFGLMAERDAKRECLVSEALSRGHGLFASVLGYARLLEIDLNGNRTNIEDARWTSGEPIQPVLIYTRMLSPVRVNDMLYMRDEALLCALAHACAMRRWSEPHYVSEFAQQLAHAVAFTHAGGGVNDTLNASNTTLCAEVTDFEWFHWPTAPSAFPDGDRALPERQAKELVYAIEVIAALAARLNKQFAENCRAFLSAYLEYGGTAIDAAADLDMRGRL